MIDVGGPSMLRGAAKNFASRRARLQARAVRTRCSRSCARAASSRSRRAAASRRRRSRRPPRTRPRSRRGSRARGRSPTRSSSRSRRCSTSRTARTRTSAPRTTPSAAPAATSSRASSSCTGRRSPSTTSTTSPAARSLAREFALPACVIVKHANPCGVAIGATLEEAYDKALASDPTSAYGGVVVLNREVEAPLGEKLAEQFVEVLFAPGLHRGRARRAAQKKNTRILLDGERRPATPASASYKRVLGGMLVQDPDAEIDDRDGWELVAGELERAAVGRPRLRVARLQARRVERDRAREGPADDRDRRRPDEPRRRGADRGREGGRVRPRPDRARRSPPTRSSRSPTARRSRSTPARRRSSSPAARAATRT